MAAIDLPARPFDVEGARLSLFQALLATITRHGRNRIALEDPERKPLSYGNLVLGALVLGRKLAAVTKPGEKVGLMLPNVQGMAVTLFGLSAYGRVPALLNFTAGLKNLSAHLSGITYTPKGEKAHLPLQESDLNLDAIFEALRSFGCAGRILIESPAMEDDALLAQRRWAELSGDDDLG